MAIRGENGVDWTSRQRHGFRYSRRFMWSVIENNMRGRSVIIIIVVIVVIAIIIVINIIIIIYRHLGGGVRCIGRSVCSVYVVCRVRQ